MTLTPEQIEKRKGFLTASAVPAALGLDPFKTRYELWAEKTGLYQPKDDPGLPARVGNAVEGAMIDWACERLEIDPLAVDRQVWKEGLFGAGLPGPFVLPLGATLDGLAPGGTIFEVKSTGVLWRTPRYDEWGEEPGGVPMYVQAQAQTQMIVVPLARVVYVPVVIGKSVRLYEVPSDPDAQAAILDGLAVFWRHVVEKRPPEIDAGVPVEVLRGLDRGGEQVGIGADVVVNYKGKKALAKAAEEDFEEAERQLYEALGTAAVGLYPGGRVEVRKESGGQRLTNDALDRLGREKPDVARVVEGYREQIWRRVLRIKDAK